MSISLKACIPTTDSLQHFLFRFSTANVLKLVIINIKEQGCCKQQSYQNPAPATESGIRAGVRIDLVVYALGGGLLSSAASRFRPRFRDLSVFQAGTLPESCLPRKPGTQGRSTRQPYLSTGG